MEYILYFDKNMVGVTTKEAVMNLVDCDEDTFTSMVESGSSCNDYECIKQDFTLDMMYRMQKILQERLGLDKAVINPKGTELMPARTLYIRHHAQYAEQELHEMLRELPYFKEWKNYDWTSSETALHLRNAKIELVDALHFILNICLALGLTPEEMAKIYVDKNRVNHIRQSSGY